MLFSREDFFSVFALYNEAIWPIQLAMYLLAVVAVAILFLSPPWQSKVVTAVLALMWTVNGVGYHWLFFTDVNPAAWIFGAAFLGQAVALAASPYIFSNMKFSVLRNWRSLAGIGLVVFAAIVYPVWGWWAGYSYPAASMFGVAPCPTTILQSAF